MTSRDLAFRLYVLAAYLCLVGLFVAISVAASDGHLMYTLDDPYIHLAVTENILRGGYGVNFPEYSAPSSSILYPLLLVVPMAAGLANQGPLLIGVGAYLVAIWFACPILLRRVLSQPGLDSVPSLLLVPLLFLFVANAVALPLMGMEHPIHVMAVVLIVSGLIDLSDGARPTWRLSLGVLLCGLIRFEGLVLGLAVIGLLFAVGQARLATLISLALAGALIAYAACMSQLGLPLLPSSVLIKSSASADAMGNDLVGSIESIVLNATAALNTRWGVLFAVSGLLLLPFALERSPRSYLARVAVIALLAHVAGGAFGQFGELSSGRYEVYGAVLVVLAAAYYGADRLRGLPVGFRFPAMAFGLLALAAPYILVTTRTPAASRNIYEQQYQMHRFATEFLPATVAVNDLGWVSYRNDAYVLDLWGLGSEEARHAALGGGRTADFLRDVTVRHGAAYAMIYEFWFDGAVPEEWCRIAELRTSQVTTGSNSVQFYLLIPREEAAMRDALADFAASLPQGASLRTFSCGEVADGASGTS